MKDRVTQTDVARAIGVHNTTVSLALRHSPLIPAATRERIQAAAHALGYTPDPTLRALAAYRKARRQQRRSETLVYLTDGATRRGWPQLPAQEQYFKAAERRATELGFQFRHVWLGEPGMSLRRLDRMLHYEDIRGLLLAHLQPPRDEEWSALAWPRLSAVKVGGSTPADPALNQVTLDAAAIMRLALRQVRLAGYRRAGLILQRSLDEFDDRAWSTAFHAEHHRDGLGEPLPVLYQPDTPSGDASAVGRWYRGCRPEVILGLAPALQGQLRRAGLSVPGDVAYADLSLQDAFQTIAGVREHCSRIGELAVELLASQLDQNVFGLPPAPTVTSVGGEWCPGSSLPARTPAADPVELPASVLTHNLVA